MMLMMSDATGFNTGGTSNILDVAASQGGSCNTTDAGQLGRGLTNRFMFSNIMHLKGISFSYQLNTALQQCR